MRICRLNSLPMTETRNRLIALIEIITDDAVQAAQIATELYRPENIVLLSRVYTDSLCQYIQHGEELCDD